MTMLVVYAKPTLIGAYFSNDLPHCISRRGNFPWLFDGCTGSPGAGCQSSFLFNALPWAETVAPDYRLRRVLWISRVGPRQAAEKKPRPRAGSDLPHMVAGFTEAFAHFVGSSNDEHHWRHFTQRRPSEKTGQEKRMERGQELLSAVDVNCSDRLSLPDRLSVLQLISIQKIRS